MDIPSTTAAQAVAPTTATSNDTGVAASVGSDFETFLALLTAQMRNQDPLKPVESTEFVSQLASFSAVEQQVRSNDTLDQISAILSGESLSSLSSWIGKEVRAEAPAAFDGAPIAVYTSPVEGANAAKLVITNDAGDVVATQAVSEIATEVTWDGMVGPNTQAPFGNYSFAVEYSSGEPGSVQTVSTPGQVFVPVTEVRMISNTANVVTEGGTLIPVEAIPAVRAAA